MKMLLLLSVIAIQAHAEEFSKEVWSKGFDHYVFTYQESSKILVSIQCLNEELSLKNSKCDAIKILENKKSVKLPPGALAGGKNPGAAVCKLALNKKVVVLKDSKNNENSFCVFDDGSMIAAITLESLIKN